MPPDDPATARSPVADASLEIRDLRYGLRLENLEGTPREIRLGQRDRGRLLLIDRYAGTIGDSSVDQLPRLLDRGDVLVLNNSKRIPGVLKGRTAVGGQVELRFVDLDEDDRGGLCAIFPMHDIEPGSVVALRDGARCVVAATGVTQHDLARIHVPDGSLRELLKAQGAPIPGFFYENHWTCDHLNPYYATEEGTVESPLAGLHFTPSLVESLERAGIEVHFVTLHSVGSWLPFLEERVDEHEMWAEAYAVPEPTADAVTRAKQRGSRVCAVGSTSLRALESAAEASGEVQPGRGRTTLYITPGYEFKVVDSYFTNFHQYQTSLIVLDAAFGGTELVLESYSEALRLNYSFFEFGDAVLFI
jgi:S-adenosylmethionine:tRNA ribosyltransferase-isomerase